MQTTQDSETAPKPPSLSSQVSRAVIWNTLFVPLRLIADVIATLLKLTALVPASYGFLSVITSYNNGFGTAIDLGTGRALPKYIPETLRNGGPRAMRRLLLVVFGAQLAILLLIALGLVVVHGQYLTGLQQQIANADLPGASGIRDLLFSYVGEHGWLLIGLTIVLQLISIFYDVLMAYLSSFFKQKAWNSIDITAQLLPKLLTIGVIVLLPDEQWQISGLLLVMVLAPAIATGALIWQVLLHQREVDALPQPDVELPLIPPGFIRYCGVSLLMNGSDFIASAGFAVVFARNLVDAAILTAGVSIVRMVLSYLYTPMVGVQVPLFTRVRAGEGGTLLGAYQSLIRLQVLLLVPGGIGLMVLANQIFAILLPQYTAAATLAWVLVPCLFLESLLTTAHNALIVYERLGTIVIARVLALIAAPVIIWLLSPLGLVGVALGFGLARVAAGLWVTVRGYGLLDLRWPWAFSLRVLLASVAMAVVVGGLSLLLPVVPSEAGTLDRLLVLPLLLGAAGVGGLTLLGALRLSGGLDPADRAQLAKMKLPAKKWLLRFL